MKKNKYITNRCWALALRVFSFSQKAIAIIFFKSSFYLIFGVNKSKNLQKMTYFSNFLIALADFS
jgi:hypothetical protein